MVVLVLKQQCVYGTVCLATESVSKRRWKAWRFLGTTESCSFVNSGKSLEKQLDGVKECLRAEFWAREI